MAAEEEKEVGGKKAGGKADPICDRSLALHFFVASGILALTVAWAIADETWLRRPYKSYQSLFRKIAINRYDAEMKRADGELKQQKASPEYTQAEAALKAAATAYDSSAERKALEKRFTELTGQLNDARAEFQVARGEYQPLVYEYDHARLEGHAKEAEEAKKKIEAAEPNIKKVFDKMNALSDERKSVQAKLGDMKVALEEATRRLNESVPAQRRYVEAKSRVESLSEMDVGDLKSYQIYNPALGVVDRCTSCHVVTDKPGYAPAEWETAKEPLGEKMVERAKHVFATHPNYLTGDPKSFDWLAAHNVSKFGCTSCHWGNGPATASPEKAHGLEGETDKSWTHPMEFQLTPLLPIGSLEAVAKGERHFGNMMEANCSKCHLSEVKLTGAPQLSYGRQLIEDVGCWGCHKIKGFELRELELSGALDRIAKELDPKKEELAKAIKKATDEGEEGLALRSQLTNLTHEIQVAERRVHELDQEIKFIGPDLNRKDAGGLKNKIYWAWLPRWIYWPQHFRPGTWMPNPLLAEDEVVEVAAYIWQQASGTPAESLEPTAPKDPKIVEEGRRLVEQRGCMACHTLEDQGAPQDIEAIRPKVRDGVGEKFAVYDVEKWWVDPKGAPINDGGRPGLLKKAEHFGPSLARVGEKIRYEWLVKWVMDPKAIQPHTRMPNLRLSGEEAEAVAAYLTTLRKDPPGGAKFGSIERAKLEDVKLAERGFRHVIRAGCFNCHQIDLKDPANGWKDVVNPGKIGAELSSHGSKPLAQFDFGFLKIPFMRNAWLETKILEPRVWDRGKYKGDPNDRLRMPRFGLNAQEAAAATTVLVGLTDQQIPGEYIYRPSARAAAIIEGERLVKKFNCRSCHVIDGDGQWARDALMKSIQDALKIDEDTATTYLPPVLNGQGHRTSPDWLFKFLKDPGKYQPLRPWHVLRMPRFDMSDAEAIALVQFFSALEKERFPYEAAKEDAGLDPELVKEGQRVFVKAQCYQCHNIGEYVPSGKKPTEQGPNFALARERLRADWIERFIPDPQAFIQGVNMPSFFGSKPFALQTPEDQRAIRAATAYVRSLASPDFRFTENWIKGGAGPGVR